ncbi:hypothetical protein AURDEDRAFT_163842 [Auricularia subglabra TFB-10046 SS5]|nr:hypothetical protein AURDEDRAFT_163842 [Auricularia subglabra TFB-10046 SS5]
MRFSALVAFGALAVGAHASAVDNCGALGVLKVDLAALPAGVDPSAVRKCKEHPLGRGGPPAKAAASPPTALEKRAQCYFNAAYGCNAGYCWKVCNLSGGGQWCWTAWDKGLGAWRTCERKEDCVPDAAADCGGECACH